MLLDERLDGNTDRPDGNYAIRRVREELWVPKSNCHLLKPLWKGPKEIKHHFTSGTIILRYIFQLKASKGNCSKNVQVEAPFSLQQPNHWASQTVQEESPWWGGAQFGPPQLVGFLADFFLKHQPVVEGWSSPPRLVAGFNPFEKYESKWESSPGRGGKKIFETTT